MQEIDEPEIYKIMDSKYIRKVRIKFRGSTKIRVVPLTRYGEVPPDGQILSVASFDLHLKKRK